MEHRQRLLSLLERLPKSNPEKQPLSVPLFISVLKRCVKYKVDAELIKHLHYFDLQCLLYQFEITDVQQYLKYKNDEQLKQCGIKEIRNISGNEAIKFLGR